jgi:glycerophosphoryl diester phosphodiesterase
LGLFLITGLFLGNENLIKKTRDLKKGLFDKIELVYALNWSAKDINLTKQNFILPKFIAHAGGGINDMKYTNSLEALDNSYQNGFKFIEMDLSLTSDEEIVMLHGWESEMEGLFNENKGIRSLAEFKNFKMVGNLTPTSFADTANWLSHHLDIYLITDIKEDVIFTLEKIKKEYPELQNRIIPQIYFFKEYAPVVELGYDKIILMLYYANYHPNLVIDFINAKNILAVSMPTNQILQNKDLITRAQELEIPVFTHTINDEAEVKKLENLGFYGVFTDFLK